MKVALIFLSLLNVMKKELSQTLRDRRMMSTLIISPVLQLVIFGYAIDLEVDRIPTVVCDQDATPESRDLTLSFFADRTFRRGAQVFDPNAAQEALETGAARQHSLYRAGSRCVRSVRTSLKHRSSWTGRMPRERK